LVVLAALGNHQPLWEQSVSRVIAGGILAPLCAVSVVALSQFAAKTADASRLFVFSYAFASGFLLTGYRLVLRHYLFSIRMAGRYSRNVVVIGLPSAIESIKRFFGESVSEADYKLLGYMTVPSKGAPATVMTLAKETHTDLAYLGDVQELGRLLVRRPVHEVIAVQPVAGGHWIDEVIRCCDYLGVVLRIVPESLLPDRSPNIRNAYRYESLNLPAIVLRPPHWNSEALFFKRVMDVIISSVLLIILSPLLVLIACVIKITTPDLPILYRYKWIGKNGVEFVGYKFTSMIRNAEDLKPKLSKENEMKGPVFKIKNDPRVTPVGRYLRKYSLNELPQLWNVLKGDMSLVGPRPALPSELERYEFWHKRKLSFNGGLTCLWQVRGRNKISDFDDWVRMDLEYIDKWSLWLDVKILIRTAWVVLKGSGS
jgi:exopolysaccharide biosynthesis polyprenyl glycosylphosphotransferase